MLQWFRARARTVAATLLVSLTALGGLSSAGHGADCHDEECAVATFPHDPSAHAMGSAADDSAHPLHCILCHFTRSFRPSTDSVPHVARPQTADVRLHTDVLGALSLVQAAQPPLRSPPATVA